MTIQLSGPTRQVPTEAAPLRPRVLEVGLFCVLVAAPLAFTPFTAAPFADPKLVLLVAGTLLAVLGGVGADRLVAGAAGVWVGALALATALGVDPWWSLMGPENQGTGLIALGASAVLLCVGTGVPDDLRARLPAWLFWTGVAVSVVAVMGRFVDIGGDNWTLGALSSTLGHRVFVGSFVAACVVAAMALSWRRPVVLAGLLLLGSGLAVTAVRAAWVAVLVGLLVALWRGRRGWRTAFGILLPLVVAVGAWTLVDPVLPKEGDIGFSAAPRFAQLEEGSAAQRVAGGKAYLRAWSDDPLLGSGPGTAWGPYLSHATPDEVRVAGRDWADAHNIVLELGVTTGTVGVVALLLLAAAVLWGARRAPPGRAWALGAAVTLGLIHLLQPLNLVLTPMLFLTAGMSLVSVSGSRRVDLRRWWMLGLVGLALLLALGRFGASSLERYGQTYDSPTALRTARALDPGRLTATDALAKYRAIDARARREGAAAEARELATEGIRSHGWHPAVRLIAADVEILLDDRGAALARLAAHLERFPNDPLALGGAARLHLEAGRQERARSLARRALAADPQLRLARSVLEAAPG